MEATYELVIENTMFENLVLKVKIVCTLCIIYYI